MSTSVEDRAPPHSPEAEQYLLSCCLLDGSDTIAACIEKPLPVAAFYSSANRIVYERLIDLYQKNPPVELAVLAESLKESGDLEKVGGYAYLTQISASIPTTAQAPYFIDKVRELFVLRELIKTSTGFVEQAFNYQGELGEFMDRARTQFETALETGVSGDELSACAYDPTKVLLKPDPVFTLKKTCICTAGNLTTLYSQAKVGKTAFVGGMIAAAMTTPDSGADTLGVVGPNYGKGALLHFDTEQSPYDHQQMIRTTLTRAQQVKPPEWFKSYLLTGKPAGDCRRLVEAAIRQAKRKFKSIFAVIIDGVADLVVDPNDSEECFPLVTRLHSLAIKYNTAIVLVLHLNPGSEEKGRGHLGSQLERKSESNLMMAIDGYGVTTVWGEKQRGKAIRKEEAVAFRWSTQHLMHMSHAVVNDSGDDARGRPPKYAFEQFDAIWPRKPEAALPRSKLRGMAHEINSEISNQTFDRLLEDAVSRGAILRVTGSEGVGFRYYLADKPASNGSNGHAEETEPPELPL